MSVKRRDARPDLVREVMIIGAGASQPYGTPSFGLFSATAQLVLEEEEETFWVTRIWTEFYRGLTLEELYTLLTFQIDLGLRIDIDFNPTISEQLRGDLKATRYVDGSVLNLRRIRDDLFSIIPVVIFAATNPSKTDSYQRIVRYAAHTQAMAPGEPRDKYRAFEFISFNWDTLLENEIRSQNLNPHYFPGERSGRNQVSVLKPHGSLEAVVCTGQECSRSRIDWPMRLVRGDNDYGNSGWTPDACPECGQITTLVLVPPHFTKTAPAPAQKWTNAVFRQVYEAIKWATKLTIVGYSLPATDYSFRLVLRSALLSRRNLSEVLVVNHAKENPEEELEFELNYRGIFRSVGFPTDDIDFDYSGVEQWARTLPP